MNNPDLLVDLLKKIPLKRLLDKLPKIIWIDEKPYALSIWSESEEWEIMYLFRDGGSIEESGINVNGFDLKESVIYTLKLIDEKIKTNEIQAIDTLKDFMSDE